MHFCSDGVKEKICKAAMCVTGPQHVIIQKYGILTPTVLWGSLLEFNFHVVVLKKCNSQPGGMHVYIVTTVHCMARKGYCIPTHIISSPTIQLSVSVPA